MAFRIKGAQVIAVLFAAGIGAYVYTGDIVIGGQAPKDGNESIAEREAKRSSDLFKVRYVEIDPEPRQEHLIVRGQTKASAVVPVRAQVSGILLERLVDKGERVKKDQIVCKVDLGSRQAQLARVQAQLAKAEADFQANSKLVEKGFASKNLLNTMKASLDAAKAEIKEAKLALERSEIKASTHGIVQDPIAEVGDMLSVGTACITLVQPDPIKFTGQISEREIDRVSIGSKAAIRLISGRTVAGEVRYIAPSADPKTRTFLTEIEIPNKDRKIRDGMTAQALIELPQSEAYRISPAWVTLSDAGKIGVRIVDENDVVQFAPVEIISQSKSEFWVRGLQAKSRIISLGQNYVVEGEQVAPVLDTSISAGIKK